MNRKAYGLLAGIVAVLLLCCIVAPGIAQAEAEWRVDPRQLLERHNEGEYAALLVDLEAALQVAEEVGDRAYAASVYRVTEVAPKYIEQWTSAPLPPDLKARLERLQGSALKLGAPMIAEEIFADLYEQLGSATYNLANVATGRQPFAGVGQFAMLDAALQSLMNARTLLARAERLFDYLPMGDSFTMQSYAYFYLKARTAESIILQLGALEEGLWARLLGVTK